MRDYFLFLYALICFRINLCHSFKLDLHPVRDSRPRFLAGIAEYLEKASRPPQLNVPRKRLELPFAINLMRSSYNAVDFLDFVAMDEFQKSFFLFRQSEWEDYHEYHPLVLQGDLADPYYFDFISFTQYATISDKCRSGKQNFVEKVGIT